MVHASTSAPAHTTPQPAPAGMVRPTDVNWVCVSGIRITYDATEGDLLAAGLVQRDELPGPRKGCNRTSGQVYAVRLQDGRLRLRMDADFAAGRTVGFKQFLGGLLSDSRLSLVRGEVRS